MAYRSRGLPSFGCNKCRARKVKCDEGRPICERCIRIGYKECKYRDPFERTWRMQTVDVATGLRDSLAAAKSVTPTVTPPPASTSPTTAGASTTNVTPATLTGAGAAVELPLLRPYERISETAEPEAVAFIRRVLFDWVMPGSAPAADMAGMAGMTPPDPVALSRLETPFLGFLPRLFRSVSPDSVFIKALSALAYASHGKRFVNKQFYMGAMAHFSGALKMLKNKMMEGSELRVTDEIMATIILFGIYEAVTNPNVVDRGSWTAHTAGAAMLLNIQNSSLPRGHSISPDISMVILRQMLLNSLLKGHRLPVPLDLINRGFRDDLPDIESQFELMYQASTLPHQWCQAVERYHNAALTATTPDTTELESIVHAALSMDNALDQWSRNIPSAYQYTMHPRPPRESYPVWLYELLDGPWAPEQTHTYPSTFVQFQWRFVWITRLVLNQALLYTLNLLRVQQDTTPSSTNMSSSSGTFEDHGPNFSISMSAFLNRTQLEANLRHMIDRLLESSLSSFIKAIHVVHQRDPGLAAGGSASLPNVSFESVPSYMGYLLMMPLPFVTLCICQTSASLAGAPFAGRLDWVSRLQRFIEARLGFAKANARLDMIGIQGIPVQLWGLKD